jgi:hypothetical protein
MAINGNEVASVILNIMAWQDVRACQVCQDCQMVLLNYIVYNNVICQV